MRQKSSKKGPNVFITRASQMQCNAALFLLPYPFHFPSSLPSPYPSLPFPFHFRLNLSCTPRHELQDPYARWTKNLGHQLYYSSGMRVVM